FSHAGTSYPVLYLTRNVFPLYILANHPCQLSNYIGWAFGLDSGVGTLACTFAWTLACPLGWHVGLVGHATPHSPCFSIVRPYQPSLPIFRIATVGHLHLQGRKLIG